MSIFMHFLILMKVKSFYFQRFSGIFYVVLDTTRRMHGGEILNEIFPFIIYMHYWIIEWINDALYYKRNPAKGAKGANTLIACTTKLRRKKGSQSPRVPTDFNMYCAMSASDYKPIIELPINRTL